MSPHEGWRNRLWKLYQIEMVTGLGIYSTRVEMICKHFFYLVWGILICVFKPNAYASLQTEVEDKVQSLVAKARGSADSGNAIVAHSARSIFYYIISNLLHENDNKLKICTVPIHFGSFYRILKQFDASDLYTIEFYEIDLNPIDFTLNSSTVEKEELKTCNLVLCMNIFGVPLHQEILFELAYTFGIPVIEDCVQSGSLHSKYRGHRLADVTLWSGGLDKTPSCFGGGFGYFKNTENGNSLYESVRSMMDELKIDSCEARFMLLLKQWIWLMLFRNHFNIIYLLGCFLSGKIYEWSYTMRKTDAITPFPHKRTQFQRKPSIYQLLSMRYGINKDYSNYALLEIIKRDCLLKTIPSKYHSILFPWMTDEIIQRMKENQGISEFSWVYTKKTDRVVLNDYLDDQNFITMINTTWVHNENSKLDTNNGENICNNLTLLPNLNELSIRQIKSLGKALTEYCKIYKL